MKRSTKKRIYEPRGFQGRMMQQKEFEQLHKELLKFDRLEVVSDDMRELIEDVWPELVHKAATKDAVTRLLRNFGARDRDAISARKAFSGKAGFATDDKPYRGQSSRHGVAAKLFGKSLLQPSGSGPKLAEPLSNTDGGSRKRRTSPSLLDGATAKGRTLWHLSPQPR